MKLFYGVALGPNYSSVPWVPDLRTAAVAARDPWRPLRPCVDVEPARRTIERARLFASRIVGAVLTLNSGRALDRVPGPTRDGLAGRPGCRYYLDRVASGGGLAQWYQWLDATY